jgi:pimeloyl-ACP methyl ester carboxylesterase
VQVREPSWAESTPRQTWVPVRGTLISRALDGSDHAIVLPSMAEHVLGVCAAATPSWYDGVGHMPFWEASDRFDRELADLAATANGSRV